MSKRIGLKIIKELVKKNVKPFKFKTGTVPNKIVEIYMRGRGMSPKKMTMEEWRKIQNQDTEKDVRELRKYLQKVGEQMKELRKHRSKNDRIIFGPA